MSDVVPYEIVEVAATGPQAEFSSALPAALGIISAGSSTAAARSDHVHPPTTDMVPAVVGAGVMQRARSWCDTADLTLTGPDGRSPRHRGYLPDRSGHGMHAWFGSTRPSGVIGRSASGAACLQPSSTVRAKAAVPVQAPTELDVRTVFRAADFTPSGAAQLLIGRGLGTSNQFVVSLNTDGTISLAVFTDGTTARWSSSGSAPTATDGVTVLAHRVTWRASDGRVQHWTKATTEDAAHVAIDDDTGWTQLGTNLTSAAVTALYPTSDQLEVGAIAGAYPLVGNIYAASYRTSIGGTIVAKFDPTNHVGEGAWVDAYGVRWDITPGADTNDPTICPAATVGSARFAGVTGNYASVPSAGLLPTSAFDLRLLIAPDRWADSGLGHVYTATGSGSALWAVYCASDGQLFLNFDNAAVASCRPPARDGETIGVRLTWASAGGGPVHWAFKTVPSDHASAKAAVQSDSGWTEIASGQAIDRSFPDVTSALYVGARGADGFPFSGVVGYLEQRNSIGGGAVVASFDPSRATSPYATFIDAQGNTWTLNRGSTASKSLTIIERAKLVQGGGSYLRIDDYGLLNPGVGSYTLCWAGRIFGPSVGYNAIAGKYAGAGQPYFLFRRTPTYPQRIYAEINDGTNGANSHGSTGADYTSGQAALFSFIVDRAAQTIRHAINGTLSTTASCAAVGAVSPSTALCIGVLAPGDSLNGQEDFGFAIFGEALSSAELTAVASHFGVL